MKLCWTFGLVILAATASADSIISATQIPLVGPWALRTDIKGARDSALLVAPAALEISEIEVDPDLQGPHRIHIGLHYEKTTGDQRYYGAALHVRLDGEPYRVLMETRRPFSEHVFKAADMTNRRLVLATLSERPAFVDYIRFEPLTPAEFAGIEAQRTAPHEMDVVGINDVNVWMWLYTTRSEWDFRDTIGQHVHAGFNRVYWMANAGAVFAKGLHFPNVTLVGIIFADLGLHLPDFRAGERTFQLLTQVAGRAGRGEVPGRVIVQTYTPYHPALEFALGHDFVGFYEEEFPIRQALGFPPVTHMAMVHFRSEDEGMASGAAERFAEGLSQCLPKDVQMIGPMPAPIAKMRRFYRYQISLRGGETLPLIRLLRELSLKADREDREVDVHVDIDPRSLL